MKQKGNHSNNMQIGAAGVGNTFNVNQSSGSFRDGFVSLSESPNSRQTPITKEAVTRRAWITILSAILPMVALFADLLGIFGTLKFDYTWFLPIYVVLVMVLALSNLDHIRIFFRRREIKKRDTYVGAGKIAHLNSSGTFTLYRRTARCIYPKCSGFIEITAPPQKEVQRCFLVGKCTDCGIVHSYKVDPNWVAYPDDIDWSEDKPSR
jgi:hypothetical protein